MLEHWFVLGCPASIKIIAWSLYNIPSCGRGNLTPTSPTLIKRAPCPVILLTALQQQKMWLEVSFSCLCKLISYHFQPLPQTFLVYLSPVQFIWSMGSSHSVTAYIDPNFSACILRGILLDHLPVPTIKVFLNEIITETVYFYLQKDGKQDLQIRWETFWSL